MKNLLFFLLIAILKVTLLIPILQAQEPWTAFFGNEGDRFAYDIKQPF